MNENDNIKSCESQNARIKEWLLQGKTLTQMEALELFQCMRLASRIHDLRNRGLNVHKEKVITPSGKYVTMYSLEQ